MPAWETDDPNRRAIERPDGRRMPRGYPPRDTKTAPGRPLTETATRTVTPRWPAAFPSAMPTPMIGREREVVALEGMLDAGAARLITLVGPGGVGKTRLVRHVARSMADVFEGRVAWVDLDPLDEPGPAAARDRRVHGHRREPGLGRPRPPRRGTLGGAVAGGLRPGRSRRVRSRRASRAAPASAIADRARDRPRADRRPRGDPSLRSSR